MHFNVSKTSYPAGKCICGQTASFLLHTLKLPGLSKDVVFLVVNFSFFFAYKISLNGCWPDAWYEKFNSFKPKGINGLLLLIGRIHF